MHQHGTGLMDFAPIEFAAEAQDMVVAVNKGLHSGKAEKVRDLLTDVAFVELKKAATANKIGVFSYHGEVERPRVVYTRSFKESKEDKNLFTQITVRMKTSQSINRGPIKDVLEFVILERFMTETDLGQWRVCGKLPPPRPKMIE
jgi:hypothetical protein